MKIFNKFTAFLIIMSFVFCSDVFAGRSDDSKRISIRAKRAQLAKERKTRAAPRRKNSRVEQTAAKKPVIQRQRRASQKRAPAVNKGIERRNAIRRAKSRTNTLPTPTHQAPGKVSRPFTKALTHRVSEYYEQRGYNPTSTGTFQMKTADILGGLEYLQRRIPGLDKNKPEELHTVSHQQITGMLKLLDQRPGPAAVVNRK